MNPKRINLFVRILKLLMSRLGKVSVIGAENLDGPDGLVIVCNHVGWVDPLWLGYSVFPRILHQMAKKELFDNPISAWFVRSGGGFPVDRNRTSAATIKHAVSLLKSGELMLVFPGGTRSKENLNAKRGAATIALYANSKLVPAYYEGPATVRFSHIFRRPSIRITFAPPMSLPDNSVTDKDSALQLTKTLDQTMQAMQAMARRTAEI